jgi:hypothetical protein
VPLRSFPLKADIIATDKKWTYTAIILLPK